MLYLVFKSVKKVVQLVVGFIRGDRRSIKETASAVKQSNPIVLASTMDAVTEKMSKIV